MKTWIGLLRGINVGGNNLLPMAELRRDLEALNLKNVRTYIQSGNLVFDSQEGTATSLAERITDQIERCHGFRPLTLVLEHKALLDAVSENPYPDAVNDPKSLHFSFLAEEATRANLETLDKLKAPGESWHLGKRVFYLHAPDGIGRSKLAAKAEQHLGVTVTARNFRTVETLLSMAAPSNR